MGIFVPVTLNFLLMPLVFDTPLSRFFTSFRADSSMDRDLSFLAHCDNSELQKLCDILTHDQNGHLRLTEHLTSKEVYLENYPEQMQSLAPAIADELLRFGSNSIATALRYNTPDSYETVVRRVCRQMKVKVGKYDNVATMEYALLEELCESGLKSLTLEELRTVADQLDIPAKGLTKQAIAAAILAAMRISPIFFRRVAVSMTYEFLSFVIGRGVAVAGARSLQRSLGVLAGPLGWIILTGWTAWDIASPAYRVCIPAVIQVALMRLPAETETQPESVSETMEEGRDA